MSKNNLKNRQEEGVKQNLKPIADDKHWMETAIEECEEKVEEAIFKQKHVY